MASQNTPGTTDPVKLAHRSERVAKKAALSLYRNNMLDKLEPGTFFALSTIHRRLFWGISKTAGRIRTVNIVRGSFRFTSSLYLEPAVKAIETMPQDDFRQIVDKYVEMSIAHPFREGNGRALRIWLDHMLRTTLGKTVNWSAITLEDYLLAMERGPIRTTELRLLLSGALTDKIDDPALLATCIDASFAYDGYNACRAAKL